MFSKCLMIGFFSMFIIETVKAVEKLSLTSATYDIVSGHTITINSAATDFTLNARYTNFPFASVDETEAAWRTDWNTANSVLILSNLSGRNCTLSNLRAADYRGMAGNYLTPTLTNGSLVLSSLASTPFPFYYYAGSGKNKYYDEATNSYNVGNGSYYETFKVLSSNTFSIANQKLGYLGKDGTVYVGIYCPLGNKASAKMQYAKFYSGLWKHADNKTFTTNVVAFDNNDVFDHIHICSAPDYIGRMSLMSNDPTKMFTVNFCNDYVFEVDPVDNNQLLTLNSAAQRGFEAVIIGNKNYDIGKLTFGLNPPSVVLKAK